MNKGLSDLIMIFGGTFSIGIVIFIIEEFIRYNFFRKENDDWDE